MRPLQSGLLLRRPRASTRSIIDPCHLPITWQRSPMRQEWLPCRELLPTHPSPLTFAHGMSVMHTFTPHHHHSLYANGCILRSGPPPAVSAKPMASVGAAGHAAATPDQPKPKDVRSKQVCAHKGCGASFSEMVNSATACKYHPGPPVFHDRSKGVRSVPYDRYDLHVCV